MDFWVWLVILFVAWALEALAGAAKKKKQTPPEERPTIPRRPPVQRRPPAPLRPSSSPRPTPRAEPFIIRVPRSEEDTEAPILLEIPVDRAPRPRDLESTEAREGVSAEVTRAEDTRESTEPQHVRALAKYGPGASQSRRASPRVMRLRQAVIWMELLGPPKGLR